MSENQSWGAVAECHFIDNLGEWNESNRVKDRPYREWLTMYINAHYMSYHEHHIKGVEYAQKKLGGLRG